MKKLLSLLMASVMISMTISAVSVCAAADILSEENITFLSSDDTSAQTVRVDISADVPLDFSSGTSYGEKNIGGDSAMGFRRPKPEQAYVTPLIFKTDFSGFEVPEGKVVEKVEFFMYSISEINGCSGFTGTIDIYNASTDWDETTTVANDWCDDKKDTGNTKYPDILSRNPDDKYYMDFTSTPDDSYVTTFEKLTATSGKSELHSFDITNAYRAAFPESDAGEGDEFAWMTSIRKDGNYRYMYIASKEHTNTMLHPYLEITLIDKPEMYIKDCTIPEDAQDSFEIILSNPIKSANIKLNGETLSSEDYEILSTKLVIRDKWDSLKTYRLEVELTDIYNQKSQKQTYDFTIGYTLSKETANCSEAYVINTAGATAVTNNDAWTSAESGSLSAFVYRFPLPKLADGARIESYKISYWTSYPSNDSGLRHGVYKWDTALGFDFASMTYDDFIHCIDNDNIHGSTECVGADGTKYLYTIDVTQNAARLAEAGETDICIIVMPNKTGQSLKFYGSRGTYGAYSEYAVNESSEILYHNKSVTVTGNELLNAEFFFTTKFNDDITSFVKLVKDYNTSETTDVQSASFEYNDADASISLSEPVTLDADSLYTIVLISGCIDKFSNVLETDLVLAKIYASDMPVVTSVKIADADFEDYDNFDELAAKDSFDYSNSAKTICKIRNKSDSSKNVLIFTLCYDNSGNLIDMAVSVVETDAQSEAVYSGETLELTGDCASVKGFVWANDYSVLSEAVVISK